MVMRSKDKNCRTSAEEHNNWGVAEYGYGRTKREEGCGIIGGFHWVGRQCLGRLDDVDLMVALPYTVMRGVHFQSGQGWIS